LAFSLGNPAYVLTVLLALAVCLLWLAKGRAMTLKPVPQGSRRVLTALITLFLLSFTLSLLIVHTRPDPNVRPMAYFAIISVMAGIVGLEIALSSSRRPWQSGVILLQIVLIGLSLDWTEQLLFASVPGADPSWHRMFTLQLIAQARIPQDLGYSSFPVTHLLTSILMLATGFHYETATLFSMGFPEVLLDVMLTFLLGKFLIHKEKPGLLAGLMLVTANYHVQFSWWATPTTLASAFLLVCVYLLVKLRPEHTVTSTFLLLFLGGVVVLTHTVTSVALAIIIVVFWIVKMAGRRPSASQTYEHPIRLGIPSILIVFMAGWWLYAFASPFGTLVDVIRSGFSIDVFYRGPRFLGYVAGVPLPERILDSLGFVVFSIIALLGCLWLLSERGLTSLAFAGSGLTVLLLGFIPSVTGREILNVRWWYYSQILLAIPAAIGLILLVSLGRKRFARRAVAAAAVAGLAFVMITSTTANTDNFMLSPDLGTRSAFTDSEMHAAAFLAAHWTGEISSDFAYATNPSSSVFSNYFNVNPSRVRSLDGALVKGNFADLHGLIVIRAAIVGHPFQLAGGVASMGYDPNVILSAMRIEKVYDSGSVAGYESP